MATDNRTDNRQSNQANEGERRTANDSMPIGFRKFKPSTPPNYVQPKPVKVPLPPRSK